MPEFKAEEEARLARKHDELAPYIEAAMKRKAIRREMRDDEVPSYEAYGFNIAEIDVSKLPEDQRRRMEAMRKMREVAARFDEAEPAQSAR